MPAVEGWQEQVLCSFASNGGSLTDTEIGDEDNSNKDKNNTNNNNDDGTNMDILIRGSQSNSENFSRFFLSSSSFLGTVLHFFFFLQFC